MLKLYTPGNNNVSVLFKDMDISTRKTANENFRRGTWVGQWCAIADLLELEETSWVHLFPTVCSMTSQWDLEIIHGGNIYTTETENTINQGSYFQRVNC